MAEKGLVSADLVEKALSKIDEFKLINYLRNLVRIPSYLGFEELKGDYISKEFERLGLEVVDVIIDAPNRRDVLGIMRGTGGGKSMMICAHLDTNWPVEGQVETAHEAIVKDGKIYGLGTGDSMAAMAAFLEAVDAIRRAKIELKGDLIFLASADELGHKEGALILEENILKADMCLVGETSGFDIGVVHSGKVEVEITTRGQIPALLAGYAEKTGKKVVNAVLSMNAVINTLLQMAKEDPYFHQKHPLLPGEGAAFYLGPIIGGNTGYGDPRRRPGRTSDEHGLASPAPIWCKLRVGARYWPGQTAQEFLEIINKWLDQARAADPNLEVSAEMYLDDGNTPIETSPDAEIVGISRRAIKHVMGREPALIGSIFSTEGPFYERVGSDVVWIGPPTLRFGTPDEHVTIEELVTTCKIYTTAILEACG